MMGTRKSGKSAGRKPARGPAGKAKAVKASKASKPSKPSKAKSAMARPAAKPAARSAPKSGPAKSAGPRPAARPAASSAGAGPAKARAASAAPAGAGAVTPRSQKAAAGKAPAVKPSGPQFPTLPGQLRQQEPLARHTTFRIGGPARWHFTPATPESAAQALGWARQEKVPVLVLGLGSNVLIRDGGFPGLVLKIGKGLDRVEARGGHWKVGAGLPTPLLARRSAEAGAAGIQRLVGVPGTVGGGVFMNAGCHGQDFAGVLVSATLLGRDGAIEERPRKAIAFGYRHSGLDDAIVLGCTLKLTEEPAERVKADLQLYLKKRREGTPFDQPCCGSVFKNPELMTAGKLIERCGLKGRRVGAVEVSALHANYIVNRGGGSADDVLRLIDVARTAVFKEFGIELELEVKVLGRQP